MACECCGKNVKVFWVLVDENMESELCRKCITDLRKECKVEPLMALN